MADGKVARKQSHVSENTLYKTHIGHFNKKNRYNFEINFNSAVDCCII